MPVEIRELIIKTEIKTAVDQINTVNEVDLSVFKEEVLEMCKRMLSEGIKKTSYRR
ncbi:DUF5908 family protein [Tenacibaculum agarivorans]|uniref:DUF5908 family protein n=1 Tax=Tenacibaculum agarivorans TaxID=1908389 RepID=UPI000A9BD937|nr:DUF5908 family protein [Tenacibaculum agarivorans]